MYIYKIVIRDCKNMHEAEFKWHSAFPSHVPGLSLVGLQGYAFKFFDYLEAQQLNPIPGSGVLEQIQILWGLKFAEAFWSSCFKKQIGYKNSVYTE